MTWTPLLHGVGFTGYRSFGDDWNPIAMDSKITVLAGQNNSGKSNVLRYVHEVLPHLFNQTRNTSVQGVEFKGIDRPSGITNDIGHTFGVAIPLTQFPAPNGNDRTIERYRHQLAGLLVGSDPSLTWLRFEQQPDSKVVSFEGDYDRAINSWPSDIWNRRDSSQVLRLLGGGPVDAKDVMSRLMRTLLKDFTLPPIETIASARRIEKHAFVDIDNRNPATEDWLSGRGIVEHLAPIQNPEHEDWAEAVQKWGSINRFVQNVLGDPDARINIPASRASIQVETRDRVLPLSSWGSGTEQVIVLAASATLLTQTLICLEEPETNLHPVLQKKLIEYLSAETDNQYLIATHSSHLLDSRHSSSYHLRFTEAGTTATPARRSQELVRIFNDLGYRPSDIMQANCVIWVEGPSDRILIRAWMKLLDSDLREGIDFSIMFYGGALVTHLTVDEEALQDFIDLRRLNRHSAVVLDSDKSSPRTPLKPAAQRIRDEFASDDAPGFSWITSCYTIENYVPRDKLSSAITKVHRSKRIVPQSDRWKNPLPNNSDKIAIARAAAKTIEIGDLSRFALKKEIQRLVAFVRHANGTPPHQ